VIDLSFSVVDARPDTQAATPTINFRLRIREAAAQPIQSILLRCQLHFMPRRRSHAPVEKRRLLDLFGEPERWGDTVQPLLWAQSSLIVPGFEGSVEIDFPVTCTYDLEVTAAKYLNALESGDVPLRFQFSGTVFAKTGAGFSIEQISWDREAEFRMPVQIWRDLMELYFPGGGWIRLNRNNLDALQRFRTDHALPSWDAAIEALVNAVEEPAL